MRLECSSSSSHLSRLLLVPSLSIPQSSQSYSFDHLPHFEKSIDPRTVHLCFMKHEQRLCKPAHIQNEEEHFSKKDPFVVGTVVLTGRGSRAFQRFPYPIQSRLRAPRRAEFVRRSRIFPCRLVSPRSSYHETTGGGELCENRC